jgi:hypothetical protein
MQMLMDRQSANATGQGAIKTLKDVIGNVGMFNGKDITKFLKTYTCEMEIYQVPRD